MYEFFKNLEMGQWLNCMKRLELALSQYKIIATWKTSSGIAVKHHRHSKVFPTGIDYLGPRGGVLGHQLIRPDGSKTRINWNI